MPETPLQINLRRLMKEKRLSAKRLTELADVSGTYVHDVLKGRAKNPRGDTLAKVAAVFDMSADELAGRDRPGRGVAAGAARYAGDPAALTLAGIDDDTRETLRDLTQRLREARSGDDELLRLVSIVGEILKDFDSAPLEARTFFLLAAKLAERYNLPRRPPAKRSKAL